MRAPDYVLDPAIAYLNHGSFGATPRKVLQAQRAWQDVMERQPMDFFERRLEGRLEAALSAVAPALGSRVEDLVFVQNATAAANAVFNSLDLQPGDEVVSTDHGYLALHNALTHRCARAGALLRVAKVPWPLDHADQILEAVRAELSPRTKLLVVDHITSPTAIVFPVEGLVSLARQHGTRILIDGAHVPGQIPVDLNTLRPDYWTGNLHKWMMAAKGTGVLWVAPEHQTTTFPAVISNHHRSGFHREFHWQGTNDPSAWLSADVAVKEWGLAGGFDARRSHHDLVSRARTHLAETLRTPLPHPDDPSLYACMATLPFPAPPERKQEITQALVDRFGVQTMLPLWNGLLWFRLSISHYNSWGDIERLSRALVALGFGV